MREKEERERERETNKAAREAAERIERLANTSEL